MFPASLAPGRGRSCPVDCEDVGIQLKRPVLAGNPIGDRRSLTRPDGDARFQPGPRCPWLVHRGTRVVSHVATVPPDVFRRRQMASRVGGSIDSRTTGALISPDDRLRVTMVCLPAEVRSPPHFLSCLGGTCAWSDAGDDEDAHWRHVLRTAAPAQRQLPRTAPARTKGPQFGRG